MNTGIVRVFDTTLRDGEQSPGATMNPDEKVALAKQLARLGVDIIEAGFAVSSPGDFEAIRRIGVEVEGPVICSLARAREEDIRRAWEALRDAPKRRLHTFHSTSDIHLVHQYRIDRVEALKRSVEMVKLAKSLIEDVEFSAMDATRTDPGYLCDVIEAVIEAGAGTVNIPDTVGYTTPEEFGALIRTVRERVRNIDRAVISVHCHNDLGLAVANSLAAVRNGAGQIECTVNGIGERAGNCSLEETVMALRARKDFYGADTMIRSEEIMRASRLVAKITGIPVQPNKAIVGANAFAHEAGIHQDGLLKNEGCYQIISPASVGAAKMNLVLGKHSGRHAFSHRLKALGYELSEAEIKKAFQRFKMLADGKGEVCDDDIHAIVSDETQQVEEVYAIKHIRVVSTLGSKAFARVSLAAGGQTVHRNMHGDGPVDAACKAIAAITGTKSRLAAYLVKGITGGTDALGEVTVGIEEGRLKATGHGIDTDIVVASAKAYVNALNRLEKMAASRKELIVEEMMSPAEKK